jgi:hypothetical protein
MSLGRPVWKETRAVLTKLLSKGETALQGHANSAQIVVPVKDIVNLVPARIGLRAML